jgi:hypothetical protein
MIAWVIINVGISALNTKRRYSSSASLFGSPTTRCSSSDIKTYDQRSLASVASSAEAGTPANHSLLRISLDPSHCIRRSKPTTICSRCEKLDTLRAVVPADDGRPAAFASHAKGEKQRKLARGAVDDGTPALMSLCCKSKMLLNKGF